MEFLNSRRPDLEIRASFFHQLTELEAKLAQTGQGAFSSTWDVKDNKLPNELLLRNTFMNAKNAPVDDIYKDHSKLLKASFAPKLNIKLQWFDEKKKVANSSQQNFYKNKNYNMNANSAKKSFYKSILKGSNKVFNVVNNNEKSQKDKITNFLNSSIQPKNINDFSLNNMLNFKKEEISDP